MSTSLLELLTSLQTPFEIYSSFCDAAEEECTSLDPNTLVLVVNAGDLNQPNINWNVKHLGDLSTGLGGLLDIVNFLQLKQVDGV